MSPESEEDKEKPSVIAGIITAIAWVVFFSSGAIFLVTTTHPDLVDKISKEVIQKVRKPSGASSPVKLP